MGELLSKVLIDIDIIKNNLTICPVCRDKIALSVQEGKTRDSQDDTWRSYCIYNFMCLNMKAHNIPGTDYNLQLPDFELSIYGDQDHCDLSWTTKANNQRIGISSAEEDETDKAIINKIVEQCHHMGGEKLADYIGNKIRNRLTFD